MTRDLTRINYIFCFAIVALYYCEMLQGIYALMSSCIIYLYMSVYNSSPHVSITDHINKPEPASNKISYFSCSPFVLHMWGFIHFSC